MSKVKMGCKNPDKAQRKRKVLVPAKPRPKSMRVPLKKVSPKQAKRLAELNKLTTKLKEFTRVGSSNMYKSELKGINTAHIESHHITGRIGKRLLNPFNIVMLSGTQHFIEQAHMSYERKQELLALIKPIRLKQGFIESDYV
ncbi:hypothetical protein M0R04_08415 [Candidatus Dojkabacteria bacterium]|jgi:hypothetical protein|nr:hypothetical protein [Candidatus Dojkabacteria bacterium]